jgi:hypothetical protein
MNLRLLKQTFYDSMLYNIARDTEEMQWKTLYVDL